MKVAWVGNPADPEKRYRELVEPLRKKGYALQVTSRRVGQGTVAGLLRWADVILVTSRSEGQPLPLLEGMACGCFVVSTDVGIAPEMIRTGWNGLLLDGQLVEFERALRWCEENLARIRRAGSLNARMVAAERSWDVLASRFGEVFQSVLQRGSRRLIDHRQLRLDADPVKRRRGCLSECDATCYADHLSEMQGRGIDSRWYEELAETLESELLPILPPSRSRNILEIGSGFGGLIRFLLESGYRSIAAVDRDRELLERVRNDYGNDLEFAVCEDAIEFLGRHKNCFDVVIGFDVIEHIDPDSVKFFLSSIYESLREDGMLIIRTPNMASILAGYSRYIDSTHLCGYTEFSLSQLMVEAGFPAPIVHLPRYTGRLKYRLRVKIARRLTSWMMRLERRRVPKCLDKNLLVYAAKQ